MIHWRLGIISKSYKKVLSEIDTDFNWGFYLNCGGGNYNEEIIKCAVSPKQYTSEVKLSLTKRPSFIGSCCGSSPTHIKEIKRFFDERIKN